MKIRSGFVSNSSSSSFIIAVGNPEKCEHCGRSDVDIIDMINNMSDGYEETEVEAVGKDNILKHIAEWWSDDTLAKLKQKIQDFKGDRMYLISVSNHNKILLDLIQTNKNINIIYGEGEY